MSVYKKTYKWNDSIKSVSFVPSEEYQALEAGKPSYLSYKTEEPPLQHKKRIPDPYTTKNLLETTNPYELAELEADSPPPLNSKSKTQVIKSKPQERAAGVEVKKDIIAEQPKISCSASTKLGRSSPSVSPPKAPRFQNGVPPVQYPHPNDKPYVPNSEEDPPKEPLLSEQLQVAKTTDKSKSKTVSVDAKTFIKPHKVAGMNEARGRDSVKTTSITKPKRSTSEYQRQYHKWEFFPKPVPKENEHDILFKSHVGVPPYKSDKIKRSSEYHNEFKNWQNAIPAQPIRRPCPEDNLSKSVDLGKAAERDARFVKESLRPVVADVPAYPMGKQKSEYDANFRDVTKIKYQNGAWKGAKQPDLFSSKDEETKEEEWVSEVVELRQKAESLKQRHLGSHISRNHLGQLVAPQSVAWDQQSSDSERLQALDLAKPNRAVPKPKPVEVGQKCVEGHAAGLPSNFSQQVDMEKLRAAADQIKKQRENVQKQPIEKIEQVPQLSRKKGSNALNRDAMQVKLGEDVEVVQDASELPHQATDIVVEDLEKEVTPRSEKESARSSELSAKEVADGKRNVIELGRVPTPELKSSAYRESVVPRHHFDRTTVIGAADKGALSRSFDENRLKRMSKTEVVSSELHKQKNGAGVSLAQTLPNKMKVEPTPTKARTFKVTKTPMFGVPTKDTHLLIPYAPVVEKHVDEAQEVESPMMGNGFSYSAAEDDLRLPLQKLGNEEDNLSVASMASTLSIASDTLEKARRRRDELKFAEKKA